MRLSALAVALALTACRTAHGPSRSGAEPALLVIVSNEASNDRRWRAVMRVHILRRLPAPARASSHSRYAEPARYAIDMPRKRSVPSRAS